jgi:hypothetical protein
MRQTGGEISGKARETALAELLPNSSDASAQEQHAERASREFVPRLTMRSTPRDECSKTASAVASNQQNSSTTISRPARESAPPSNSRATDVWKAKPSFHGVFAAEPL